VTPGPDQKSDRRTIRLLLAYDGTDFGGWQRQTNRVTIQELLEEALSEPLRERVACVAAGRTDAGVHAEGQVVSFRTRSTVPLEGIQYGGNALMPRTIAILDAREVDPAFHAQRDAVAKHYRYRILNRRVRAPLSERFVTHVSKPLDVDRMREAAAHLRGEHDFESFRNAGSVDTSPVRTLRRLDIVREGDYLSLEFEADGFLYRMVRNLVGTLLLVGGHAIDPDAVAEVLAARDRTVAGPAAPARGLCLVEVFYE
jgi:tRNA pseudouridine38-40 synthase